MWLALFALCVVSPQPRELRDPFRIHTPLRNPFDADFASAPELRDPFSLSRDLKSLPPSLSPPPSNVERHAELRIPAELR